MKYITKQEPSDKQDIYNLESTRDHKCTRTEKVTYQDSLPSLPKSTSYVLITGCLLEHIIIRQSNKLTDTDKLIFLYIYSISFLGKSSLISLLTKSSLRVNGEMFLISAL